MKKKGFTQDVEKIIKSTKDLKNKDPKVKEQNLKNVQTAIDKLKKVIKDEGEKAIKSLETSQKNLKLEQAKSSNEERIKAVQAIVEAKQAYLTMVKD